MELTQRRRKRNASGWREVEDSQTDYELRRPFTKISSKQFDASRHWMNLPYILDHKFQSRITKGAFLAQRHNERAHFNDHHNTNIVRALLPRYKDINSTQDFQVLLQKQTVCCTQYVAPTYYVWISFTRCFWSYHVYNIFWHYPLLNSLTFELCCKQNSFSTLYGGSTCWVWS